MKQNKPKLKFLETESQVTDWVYFMPASLFAFYCLYKYFTVKSGSKDKLIFGWAFIIGLFSSIMFWLGSSQT